MATNFSSDIKKAVKKSVIRSFLGSGAIGRAATKRFVGEEEEHDPVAQALDEQTQIQNEINATIVRMEPVVLNIADNVYNIAGVWAERVASMEEAKREQRERVSKEQAALEEAENEAARELAPLPSATTGSDAMNQQETSERGLLGRLADSIGGLRGMLRGVMGKVARLATSIKAAGWIIGGAGLMAAAASANDETPQPEKPAAPYDAPIVFNSDSSAYGGGGADLVTPPPSFAATGGTSGAVPSDSTVPGGTSGAVSSAPSVSGGTSGAVGAVSSAAGGLSGIIDNPDPAANGGLSPSPESGGAPTGGLTGAVAGAPSAAGGTSGAVEGSAPSAGGLAGASGTLSSTPGGLAGSGGDTSTSPGGLSGIGDTSSSPSSSSMSLPSTASSGRDISALSSMPMSQTTGPSAPVVIQNSSGMVDDQSEPSPLPSPIADRGSLDIDVYFRSRYA